MDKLRQAEREGGGVGLTAAIRSIKQTEPKKKKKKNTLQATHAWQLSPTVAQYQTSR